MLLSSLLGLSPTTLWKYTFMPMLFSLSDMYWAFVFTICPIKSSVPTAKISAFIFAVSSIKLFDSYFIIQYIHVFCLFYQNAIKKTLLFCWDKTRKVF